MPSPNQSKGTVPEERWAFLTLKERLLGDDAARAFSRAVNGIVGVRFRDDLEDIRFGLAAAWNFATGHESFSLTQPEVPRCGDESDYERVARAFHGIYEAAAPDHGYETRPESRVAWAEVPEKNRALMIGTVRRLAETGVIAIPDSQPTPDLLGEGLSSDDRERLFAIANCMQLVTEDEEVHADFAARDVRFLRSLASTQPVSESPGGRSKGSLVKALAKAINPTAFEKSSGFGHQEFAEEDREERQAAREKARELLPAIEAHFTQPVPGNSGGLRKALADPEAVEQIARYMATDEADFNTRRPALIEAAQNVCDQLPAYLEARAETETGRPPLTPAEARELYAIWLNSEIKDEVDHEHPVYTGGVKLGEMQSHPEDEGSLAVADRPRNSGGVEEGWPELWIQRSGADPELWVIWGSAEGDATPYDLDDCRLYSPQPSAAPTQPPSPQAGFTVQFESPEEAKSLLGARDPEQPGDEGAALRERARGRIRPCIAPPHHRPRYRREKSDE